MFQSVGLPHGFCFLWNPQLLWLNIASDSMIALAYFLIPIALVRIVRKRRDVPFNGVLFCFAAFIVSCGLTHVMEVVTLWFPIYWVSGTLKAVTASVSVATLAVLIRITPGILALPHQLADRRFQALIEDAPDAILQVDARGIIVIANRTAERIFGYSPDELLGVGVEQLIPIDRRSAHRKHREDFANSGVSRPMGEGMGDLFARRRDGTNVPVEIALSPVKTAIGVHVTAIIRDVSDRKRIERELELTNAELSSVLENTSTCVLAMDGDWTIHYMNASARQLLNQRGDVMGKNLWDAFPAMDENTQTNLRRSMETRQPVAFENYYQPLDVWSSLQLNPLGESGLTIYFNNVSEQRRLEKELEMERAQRNQRTEVLARLSSGLAHEIKNPLAIIHARASDLAEMASEGEVQRAEIERNCASIVQTSNRALRILRGVAAMSRVGTHDPMEDADVAGIVAQAVELVEGRYREAGIRLETAVPPALPPLECREVQISQILVNLLHNAFDAVEADARSERWVRVQVSTQAGSQHEDHIERLEIDVIDSGAGVAPEHKERLMQTFFTTKSMGAGIGIGLSVSRTIAEDHGGQLELRDCDGHTCFRLTLPVRPAREQGVAA